MPEGDRDANADDGLAERDHVEELVPVADPEPRLAPSRCGITCVRIKAG
jgi:hypothetical protein